ncbi:MAG: ABC transporter ATP-binding protein [Deltaproteobacteria bacterium]|nr:ABC transporter ATP-binding protein [Deltaproteobacteria bacterium]
MNDLFERQEHETVLVDVAGLTKDFHTGVEAVRALRGVDLRVRQNEMVAVMGPSGSGKSTLLFILGLLLYPTTGSYRMMGRDMLSLTRSDQAGFRRRYLGFVFQGSDLVETCNVYENLELPLIYAEVPAHQRPSRISQALERVELLHRMHHPANLLSGGERQRVAVARALVNEPRLILADEPTGQLDQSNGRHVMDYLEQIAGDGKSAVIVVTHDPAITHRCHRICRLEDGVLYES